MSVDCTAPKDVSKHYRMPSQQIEKSGTAHPYAPLVARKTTSAALLYHFFPFFESALPDAFESREVVLWAAALSWTSFASFGFTCGWENAGLRDMDEEACACKVFDLGWEM